MHSCFVGLRGEPEIPPYRSRASDGGWACSRKQLCTVIVVSRGLQIPEEPKRGATVVSVSVWRVRFSPRRVQMFTSCAGCCLIPGAANTQRACGALLQVLVMRVCCTNLVSLLVRGISLPRSVRYFYTTLRGVGWGGGGIGARRHLPFAAGACKCYGKLRILPTELRTISPCGLCGAVVLLCWRVGLCHGSTGGWVPTSSRLCGVGGVWPSGPHQRVDLVRHRARMERRHWCHSCHRVTQA